VLGFDLESGSTKGVILLPPTPQSWKTYAS
jgi:hypothetical protein